MPPTDKKVGSNMILADGINLPIVLIYGLATFGPLTLLVTSVEGLVLWLAFGVSFKASFWQILIANICSTLAGAVVWFFQAVVVSRMVIRTMPDFVNGYSYVAIVLILIYYAKSVLVEGLVLLRAKARAKIGLRPARLWKAVLLANIASYLIMGPIFYLSTRPTFGGVEFVDSAASVVNCDDTVYYIAAESKYLCKIKADGTGQQTLVPYPVADYIVTSDQKTFVYRAQDGNLYSYSLGEDQPLRLWQTDQRFDLDQVALSCDKRFVAFAEEAGQYKVDVTQDGEYNHWEHRYRWRIEARRMESKAPVAQKTVETRYHHPLKIVWDSSDANLLYYQCYGVIHTLRVQDGQLIETGIPRTNIQGSSFQHAGGGRYGGASDWGVTLDYNDKQKGLELFCMPGLDPFLVVNEGAEEIVRLRHDYGLLGIGNPGPSEASFLTGRGNVIFQAGEWLYILDSIRKKAALLVRGRKHVLTTKRFQTTLKAGHDMSD